jgi:cytochrome oxidase Cu insertion factor (SCO1/SenC/PrrC family)
MRWKWIGLVVGSAIALLAAGGWVLQSWLAAPQPSQGKALIDSEFSLVDHTGKPVTDEDFAGKWQLVFFGFTYCPDVCPTTLNDISVVLEELDNDADQVTPLFTYYAKMEQKDQPGGYTMDHSAFLYLMDPEGEYATHSRSATSPQPSPT